MCGSHDALIVRGNIDVQFVEIDILLVMGSDQVVKSMAGDREHRLAIAFRVVQPVEKMDAARSRSGDTNPEASAEFRITARGKGRSFLVAYLDKANLVLAGAKRFEHPVHAVTRESKDRIHTPFDQAVD